MGVVKRVTGLAVAGAVLAGALAGCSAGVSEAEACEAGYTAMERMSNATGANATTPAGIEQLFVVNDDVVKQIRAFGATGELAEAHEAVAVAIEEFTAAGRQQLKGSGAPDALDAASVKLVDAGSKVDAICGD